MLSFFARVLQLRTHLCNVVDFFVGIKRKESPAVQILNEEGLNPMALIKFQIYRFPTYYQPITKYD